MSTRYGLRPALKPDPDHAAAGRELHDHRQLRRVAEVEIPRALRAPSRHRDLARHLRRPAGDVPGLAGRDLRAVPGPGCQLVLSHVHGRRRIRLRPALVAAPARPRRAGECACCSMRSCRRRFPIRRSRRAAAAAAGGRHLRAPDRQSGVAPFRAVRGPRAGLRGPRRRRARRAHDRAARQLRLPGRLGVQPERRDPRRGRADRHRRAQGRAQHDAREPDAAQDTRFGALVAPNLVAPNHSHFFNFRLDLDVDGRNNSFMLGELETKEGVPGPRKSVWVVDEKRIDRERDGTARARRMRCGRSSIPNRTNARGYNTGYVLESHSTPIRCSRRPTSRAPASSSTRCGSRATTPTSASRPATRRTRIPASPACPPTSRTTRASSTPTSCCGSRSAIITSPPRRTFPVLSLEPLSFRLKPVNFFDRNPALDLRRAPFEAP